MEAEYKTEDIGHVGVPLALSFANEFALAHPVVNEDVVRAMIAAKSRPFIVNKDYVFYFMPFKI